MAWNKNPFTYPKIFHDLLEAARESRVRVRFRNAKEKHKYQFYAFKAAWEAKAAASRKLQNFALAAQEQANADMLGLYVPVVDSEGVSFVSKDSIVEAEGIALEISNERTDGAAGEIVEMVAQANAQREQDLLGEEIRRKHGAKAARNVAPVIEGLRPIENTIATRIFGTAEERRNDVTPEVVEEFTEEEKETLRRTGMDI